ncbi:MAG: 5'-deoxynucleotidase, partial [Clostridia bacterium]
GDLPTPIKYYNPEINIAYKQIENISKERLIGMLPEEMKETYRSIYFSENTDSEMSHIVKAADKISAFIKCVEEEKAGNTEFKKAREALHDYLTKNKSSEVEYFMKEFIPSFYLTLDEID